MKIFLSIGIILLILVGCFAFMVRENDGFSRDMGDYTPTVNTPSPVDETDALRLIAPENHREHVVYPFFHNDAEIKFYQRQLKALDYIREHKIKAALPQLILYLDYPTSQMEAGLKDPAHGRETDRGKKVWPAFGALLEMPGSGEALQDYSLDPTHPMRYRQETFIILSYMDPHLVESCWQALKNKGQDKEFQKTFDWIKTGHAFFWGVEPNEDLWPDAK